MRPFRRSFSCLSQRIRLSAIVASVARRLSGVAICRSSRVSVDRHKPQHCSGTSSAFLGKDFLYTAKDVIGQIHRRPAVSLPWTRPVQEEVLRGRYASCPQIASGGQGGALACIRSTRDDEKCLALAFQPGRQASCRSANRPWRRPGIASHAR